MRTRVIGSLVLGILLIAGGCGRDGEREPVQDGGGAVASAPVATEDTVPAELRDWRLHLQQMRGMHGDSLRALLPGYRQRFSGMMGQGGWMMGSRGGMPMMQGDSAWIALRDSLHQDMARLSGASDMSDEELERWMAAHQARALRMMEYPGMHRGLR